jgi:hypothetical protein
LIWLNRPPSLTQVKAAIVGGHDTASTGEMPFPISALDASG